jgi:hypothetical protein
MNNGVISHEKSLPTNPVCLSLIRKDLIGHVTYALAFGYEEKEYL